MRSPVLLISTLYPPDNYSGAARAGRFGKYLQRKGYAVDVLAAGTSLQPVVEGGVHRVRGELEFVEQKDFSAFLERVARKLLFPADMGSTWCWRALRYGRRLLGGAPLPVILSTSPPVFTHLAAWRLKMNSGAPWIADFRDPFAGMPWRSQHRRTRWLDPRLEATIFRHADAVIANTDATADMWRKRYPAMAERIHLIWNGFDPEEPLVAEPLPPRAYTVLAHVGDIYGNRRPGVLLESVERLLRAGAIDATRFRIHLAGPLDDEALGASGVLERLVQAGCVMLTGRIPKAEANRIIATADSLLLLDVFHAAAPLQVPAKLFDYVRIGRPILACTRHGSPVDRILASSGICYATIAEGDPAPEVDRNLLEFLALPSTPLAMSETFRNTFDGARQVDQLSRIIDAVAAQARVSKG